MIGLAFSGGSVRGAYEIGAYWAFKKCHIKIDGFVGTSIGSFNAAMLAAGRERELLHFWRHVNVAKLLKLDANFVNSLENKDLKGMKNANKNIQKYLEKTLPLENLLKEARKIEIMQNLVENTGSFDITEDEKELADALVQVN